MIEIKRSIDSPPIESSPNGNEAIGKTQETSSDVAISVRNVSKMYPLYSDPQARLRQSLWYALPKFLRGSRTPEFYREFWALRDISFEVKKGETVGIIGRNGSGKSTLLQIIAGTLAPTHGEVAVTGRVAALLELGSGFNYEFTGRENVYLNGAIWGLSYEQVAARFDTIAAFADIGQFIDQPVKLYSSGMFARLAFAVAVNVEPDILIVDEILAVGDIQFQQKCVSRLREMKENGLTLLFTSHSVDSLKSVCNSGILLNQGQCLYIGTAEQTTNIYLNMIRDSLNEDQKKAQEWLTQPVELRREEKGQRRYGTGHVQIESVRMLDETGQPKIAYQFGEKIVLEIIFHCLIDVDHLSISFLVRDITGIDLMGTTTFDEQIVIPPRKANEKGRVRLSFTNQLRANNYGISVAINRVSQRDISDNVLFDQIDGAAAFSVIRHPGQPIHYKFYCPIAVEFHTE